MSPSGDVKFAKPYSPQQRRHLRRRVLLHRRQRVSVDVERDVGLCMPEPLRDHLDGNARLQCQGRARVTKAVRGACTSSDNPQRHTNETMVLGVKQPGKPFAAQLKRAPGDGVGPKAAMRHGLA